MTHSDYVSHTLSFLPPLIHEAPGGQVKKGDPLGPRWFPGNNDGEMFGGVLQLHQK